MRIQLKDTEGAEQNYDVVLEVAERDDGSIKVKHINEDDVVTTTEFSPEWRITSAMN